LGRPDGSPGVLRGLGWIVEWPNGAQAPRPWFLNAAPGTGRRADRPGACVPDVLEGRGLAAGHLPDAAPALRPRRAPRSRPPGAGNESVEPHERATSIGVSRVPRRDGDAARSSRVPRRASGYTGRGPAGLADGTLAYERRFGHIFDRCSGFRPGDAGPAAGPAWSTTRKPNGRGTRARLRRKINQPCE